MAMIVKEDQRTNERTERTSCIIKTEEEFYKNNNNNNLCIQFFLFLVVLRVITTKITHLSYYFYFCFHIMIVQEG